MRIAVLALALTLVGCGGSSESSQAQENDRAQQEAEEVMASSRVVCRDGVQYLVGRGGGPFVTPRAKRGGGYYECAVTETPNPPTRRECPID